MKISETMLPEFDQEMASTRKVLERVPLQNPDWKPHPKSSSVSALAAHIANMPDWAGLTLETDSFDYAPPGAPPYETPKFSSKEELLAAFDKSVAGARAALVAADDSQDACAMDTDGRRKDHDDHAEGRRHSQLRDEPHHPSSRAARRLPSPERYSGAFRLRPHRGRAVARERLQNRALNAGKITRRQRTR